MMPPGIKNLLKVFDTVCRIVLVILFSPLLVLGGICKAIGEALPFIGAITGGLVAMVVGLLVLAALGLVAMAVLKWAWVTVFGG